MSTLIRNKIKNILIDMDINQKRHFQQNTKGIYLFVYFFLSGAPLETKLWLHM